MVAPITRTRRPIPTAVFLDPPEDGVERPSAVVLDHIQSIRVESLERFVARLRPEKIREIEQAIRIAFALPEATAYQSVQ